MLMSVSFLAALCILHLTQYGGLWLYEKNINIFVTVVIQPAAGLCTITAHDETPL